LTVAATAAAVISILAAETASALPDDFRWDWREALDSVPVDYYSDLEQCVPDSSAAWGSHLDFASKHKYIWLRLDFHRQDTYKTQ